MSSRENYVLYNQELNDLDRTATQPQEMAQIAVLANLFADGLAEFHQCSGIINNKVRMHFESKTFDAVIARVFGCFLPIGEDFFIPLPVLHVGVFGGPAISDPIRLGILRSAARAAGKTDDDSYLEDFGEEDGLAEGIDVFLGMLGIGMNGVAMTTESGDANSPVFKLFLPGFGL